VQPSSSEFASLVSQSHRYISRLAVTYGGDVVDDTFYLGRHIALLDGSVAIDRGADTRRRSDLHVLDVSGSGKTILAPIQGSEIEVYRGIILESTGLPEWKLQGRFTAQDLTVSKDGGSIVLDVAATDRSDRVRQNPLTAPYQVANTTNQITALTSFYSNRASGFTPAWSVMETAKTSPDAFYHEEDDPWQVILDMAKAAAGEVFHDYNGVLIVQAIPDPNLLPVTIQLPRDKVSVLPISRSISRRDVYNGVIVRGEAAWLLFQVSGTVWDTDPLSPTYYLGPFGQKPKNIGSPLASSDAECAAIATSEFKNIQGVSEDITFNMLPDPRIVEGDVLEIVDNDLGVAGRYMIDSLRMPLRDGALTGTVKRKR
jgi:hypothetical protein